VRRTALTLIAVLALSVGSPAVSGASGGEKYPVTYNFLSGAVAAGYPFDADPPGANDFSCRPSKAHPRPVVLVHGTLGNKATNWQTYAPLLANNGYCVFAFTYGVAPGVSQPLDQFGGLNSIESSAQQMKRFVGKVLRRTGAAKVDVVGHSQGTVVPEYYAKFLGGRTKVRHYISLAPLWHGTGLGSQVNVIAPIFGANAAELPVCGACGEMSTGSSFGAKLRKGGLKLKGIRYTNIMTRYDELVQPYTSGRVRGMHNIVVQDLCATDYTEHFEIASDPVAAQVVLNTLDPSHAQPVPCMVVLPFEGPVGSNSVGSAAEGR
jgi:triacylglycerol lipase